MINADEPPRDLADRIIRRTLPHPPHLRSFLQQVVPDLADGFDCDRAKLLERVFLTKDWRRREADLPFEVPYRTGAEELSALVFVLVEHQSDTDALLPLRMLFYSVSYWERQWKAWEGIARPRPAFRLHPVLPIVLYTGATPWGSNQTLAELFGEPAALHAFAPSWQPLFWNLSEYTPQALLDSGAEWLQMLAVMRATGTEAADFRAVYVEALRRLQAISEKDVARWEELVNAIMTWGQWRRPANERDALQATAAASQTNPVLQERVRAMGQTIAESYIEEGQLMANRKTLRRQLTIRFGHLPEALLQRIETAEAARLDAALDQVVQLKSLDELTL